MKTRTRKSGKTDDEFAYEMIKRRHRQDERRNPHPYVPRSKYQPNKLPLYKKGFRNV